MLLRKVAEKHHTDRNAPHRRVRRFLPPFLLFTVCVEQPCLFCLYGAGKLGRILVRRSRLIRILPFAVLLVEALAFYRHVLFHGGYVIPWDLRYYHLPIAEFVAKCFRNGELPLWNPDYYCGFPIYANITTQLFYPPTVLAIWLSNLTGGENLLYFLEWQIVLHVFAGGALAYLLLRRLGASMAPALLGGTVFQLGCFFASQIQHMGAMNGAAWLPLAWLAVISLSGRPSARWAAVLGAAFSMAILSGFPAVSFVVVASSVLLGAILLAFRRAHRSLLWTLPAACALSLLLAAVQVFPTIELTQLSVAKFRSDWMGTGGGMPLQSLMSLLVPNYYGIFDLSRYKAPWQPTFLYLYCGIPGLVLAVAAMAGSRKLPWAAVFTALTGLSVFWMLGDSTPVGRFVFRVLPDGIKASVYPEFALVSFSLGMAVLAGLGAHAFFASRSAVMGAWLVAIAALDLIMVGSNRPMNTASLEKEPGLTREAFDGNRFVLERARSLSRQARPPWRIDTAGDAMNWVMGTGITGVPTAGGNDPFALIRFMQVRLSFTGGERWGRYYEVRDLDSPVLDLLNVRYVLSRAPIEQAKLDAAGFSRVAQLPGRDVYENPEALPRFFLVNRVRNAADMGAALAVIREPGFDPGRIAAVEGLPDGELASGEVKVIVYQPRRVVLETNAAGPAFLATSETHYPGWKAFVDGRSQRIVMTNAAFRGLAVPTGRHRIEMRFEPAILLWSATVSALAWAFFAWIVLRRRRSVEA